MVISYYNEKTIETIVEVVRSAAIGSEELIVLEVGNKFFTLLPNMFTNLNLTDMETGYKAFRASLIKSNRKLLPSLPARDL